MRLPAGRRVTSRRPRVLALGSGAVSSFFSPKKPSPRNFRLAPKMSKSIVTGIDGHAERSRTSADRSACAYSIRRVSPLFRPPRDNGSVPDVAFLRVAPRRRALAVQNESFDRRADEGGSAPGVRVSRFSDRAATNQSDLYAFVTGTWSNSVAFFFTRSPRRSYRAVVTGDACPASCWTVAMSAPPSRRSPTNVRRMS